MVGGAAVVLYSSVRLSGCFLCLSYRWIKKISPHLNTDISTELT